MEIFVAFLLGGGMLAAGALLTMQIISAREGKEEEHRREVEMGLHNGPMRIEQWPYQPPTILIVRTDTETVTMLKPRGDGRALTGRIEVQQ